MKEIKRHKILFGLGSAAYSAIVLAIIVLLNYISLNHYKRFDVTTSQMFSLSGKSLKVINGLKEPVSVLVLYSPSSPLYGKIKNLLSEYRNRSVKLSVEFIDPEKNLVRIQAIVQKYKIETANRIIFEQKDKIKHITDTDLAEKLSRLIEVDGRSDFSPGTER